MKKRFIVLIVGLLSHFVVSAQFSVTGVGVVEYPQSDIVAVFVVDAFTDDVLS